MEDTIGGENVKLFNVQWSRTWTTAGSFWPPRTRAKLSPSSSSDILSLSLIAQQTKALRSRRLKRTSSNASEEWLKHVMEFFRVLWGASGEKEAIGEKE